jgi:hypothetical protein
MTKRVEAAVGTIPITSKEHARDRWVDVFLAWLDMTPGTPEYDAALSEMDGLHEEWKLYDVRLPMTALVNMLTRRREE